MREAEFVSPEALRLHYTRIVEGYIEGLRRRSEDGEIGDIDPTVAAWALMGIGEMIGMRWVLWGDAANARARRRRRPDGERHPRACPTHVLDEMMRFIGGALGRPGARDRGAATTQRRNRDGSQRDAARS